MVQPGEVQVVPTMPLFIARRAFCSGAAFSYIEVVVSLAVLIILMGAFVIVIEGGAEGFTTGCVRGDLNARIDQALGAIGDDLRETGGSYVRTRTADLPPGQCALLLPSPRDIDGVFHLNSSYQPVWLSVVVYCPYVNLAGVSQLRRYAWFFDEGAYTLPFEFTGITGEEITLEDALGRPLTIDRAAGNTTLPAGREYVVVCADFAALSVATGSPMQLGLSARSVTRRGVELVAEGTRYVAARN